MAPYVIRRLLQAIPLLLAISLFSFFLMDAMPGGPLGAYGQRVGARAEDIERLKHQLGLDRPVPVQYVMWLGRWVRGDWGQSYKSKLPVRTEIMSRLPNSLLLMSTGFAVAISVGVTAGVIAAWKRYSMFDYFVTTLAFIGVCMPVFWFGLLLLMFMAVKFKLLPAGGMYTLGAPFSITDRLQHMILPVIAVAFQLTGGYTRYIRTSLLEVLDQDYIRTATAKGLRWRTVMTHHALRNALIPLVTILGMQLPWIIGGFVITESIFSWPGMGRLFWTASIEQDYPVIMGVVMLVGVAVVFFNLLADILYGLLDPRIAYE
jgi:peptide/nickel transport system permease protein